MQPVGSGIFATPDYSVVRTDYSPPIDDTDLTPFWRSVMPMTLVDTVTGNEPPFLTEVRLCWTDDKVHFHFYCIDSEVYSEFKQRDDPIYDQEVIEIFIAEGSGKPTEYREFEVSPFNIQWDGNIRNLSDSREQMFGDAAWDATSFESRVRIDTADSFVLPSCVSWSARISIAFQDISRNGRGPSAGDVWRANFFRIERQPHECYMAWSPTLRSPADFHVPSRFGRLIFTE